MIPIKYILLEKDVGAIIANINSIIPNKGKIKNNDILKLSFKLTVPIMCKNKELNKRTAELNPTFSH